MKTHLVFVYGSLRKNYGNHHRLDGATFIDTDTIRGKLFTTHGAYPFLTRSNSNKDRITGEIYEVTKSQLWHSLDSLEGFDRRRPKAGLYFRPSAMKPGWRQIVFLILLQTQQAFILR